MARTTFFAKTSATAVRATAVYTTAVELTHTPNANSAILYIGSLEVLASTGNGLFAHRLRHNTLATSLSYCEYSTPIVTSAPTGIYSPVAIVSYGGSPGSNSISIDVQCCTATQNLQRSNAVLWGIQLAGNDAYIVGADTYTSVTSQTWATVGSQLTVSVATSGKWLLISYAEASAQLQGTSTAQTTQFRMVIDGSATKKTVLYRMNNTFVLNNFYVYGGIESFTAGSHTINMQASYSGAVNNNASKVRRVRHAALEVSAFAYNYIDVTSVGVSASNVAFATIASFNPDIQETKNHVELFYGRVGTPQPAATNCTARLRIMRNAEDIGNNGHRSNFNTTGSLAGTEGNPFFIVNETTVTSGIVNGYHFQTRQDDLNITHHTLENRMVFIAQLTDASVGGGPQTTAKSVEAVGRGVASIIKTVGANRVAIGGGRASVQKTVGATRGAVARGVADVGAHEVFSQLMTAVGVAVASMATSSQFRIALESVAVAIATISSRTTRNQVIEAVGRAIAEFSSHTTRLGNLVAFTRNIASTLKTVGKNIEAQGRAIAADQVGYFVRQEAVATAVAFLADATRVTASGSAVVVTANPYVLSLGDSVKRFKSLLQHGAGLGRGTTSDRDPDS